MSAATPPDTPPINRRAARHLLIKMARRRQKPGSGSTLAFLRERTFTLQFPDLNQVLNSIEWAVVGAAAARKYMPERATQAFDILIVENDAPDVEARFGTASFRRLGDLSIGSSAWQAADGFPVDVLYGTQAWCAYALQEAQNNRDPASNPILPLPYLVPMKLAASRAQDVGDLSRMLGGADADDLRRVRQTVARFTPEDREDVESLILLGQLEMQPQPVREPA